MPKQTKAWPLRTSEQLTAATASWTRCWIDIIRLIHDQRIRAQNQLGRGDRVADRGNRHLHGVDDASLEHIDECSGPGIEAYAFGRFAHSGNCNDRITARILCNLGHGTLHGGTKESDTFG